MPEENPQVQPNTPENHPQVQPATPAAQPAPAATQPTPGAKEPNKVMGCLSYLGILFLIPMFVLKPEEKDNYIITHLRQGAGVFAIEFIGWVISFLAGILSLTFLIYVGYVFYLISFIFAVLGIINALKPNSDKLPYVGDFFDKNFSFIK